MSSDFDFKFLGGFHANYSELVMPIRSMPLNRLKENSHFRDILRSMLLADDDVMCPLYPCFFLLLAVPCFFVHCCAAVLTLILS